MQNGPTPRFQAIGVGPDLRTYEARRSTVDITHHPDPGHSPAALPPFLCPGCSQPWYVGHNCSGKAVAR